MTVALVVVKSRWPYPAICRCSSSKSYTGVPRQIPLFRHVAKGYVSGTSTTSIAQNISDPWLSWLERMTVKFACLSPLKVRVKQICVAIMRSRVQASLGPLLLTFSFLFSRAEIEVLLESLLYSSIEENEDPLNI